MSDGPKIALVNMPFSSSKYPSIQLGTLATVLKSHGLGVKTYHLYLHFAYQIGVPLYEVLCEKRGLLGEWLFSHLLFRDHPKNNQYARTFKPIFEDVASQTGCPPSFLEELKQNGAPQRALNENQLRRGHGAKCMSAHRPNAKRRVPPMIVCTLRPGLRCVRPPFEM